MKITYRYIKCHIGLWALWFTYGKARNGNTQASASDKLLKPIGKLLKQKRLDAKITRVRVESIFHNWHFVAEATFCIKASLLWRLFIHKSLIVNRAHFAMLLSLLYCWYFITVEISSHVLLQSEKPFLSGLHCLRQKLRENAQTLCWSNYALRRHTHFNATKLFSAFKYFTVICSHLLAHENLLQIACLKSI